MELSLLSIYMNWYEELLPRLRDLWPWVALVLFGTSGSLALVTLGSGKSAARCLVLSLAAFAFVFAAYFSTSPREPLVACLILLVAYLLAFGLHAPTMGSTSRGLHRAAWLIIAASTAVKLLDLETWPPLLNDYAAQTGVEVYKKFAQEPLTWISTRINPYLNGGGTSLLHAPIVMASYAIFGHSIFAVRFAEVVGSTLLLVFLWSLFRELKLGYAGLLALLLFAFSGEHLATSRMGTFYSISLAISLCVLWLATAVQRSGRLSKSQALGLFFSIGVLPFAYAPAGGALLFLIAFVTVTLARRTLKPPHRWALAVLCAVALLVASAGWYQRTPFKRFTGYARILATDAPVWFKAEGFADFRQIAPLSAITSNVSDNLGIVFSEALTPRADQERLYTFATVVLLCGAVIGLASTHWGPLCLYSAIGFLPLLLIFPLQRRGILIRPFVPLVVALFVHEYLHTIAQLAKPRSIRYGFFLVTALLMLSIPFQGIYYLAKYNGPVGAPPSFGPEYASTFIKHLKELSRVSTVVVLNTGQSQWQYEMAFAETLIHAKPEESPFLLATVSTKQPLLEQLPSRRPLTVAVLNESRRSWIPPLLKQQVPTADIKEFYSGTTLMYWIATVPE